MKQLESNKKKSSVGNKEFLDFLFLPDRGQRTSVVHKLCWDKLDKKHKKRYLCRVHCSQMQQIGLSENDTGAMEAAKSLLAIPMGLRGF